MKRKTVTFTAPRQVELREESLPALGADDVLVETLCSSISAGTEMGQCGPFRALRCQFLDERERTEGRIQTVSATSSVNFSDGVMAPRVSRGRPLSSSVTRSSSL